MQSLYHHNAPPISSRKETMRIRSYSKSSDYSSSSRKDDEGMGGLSALSSIRSSTKPPFGMDDNELSRALRKIEQLTNELRLHEDLDRHVATIRDRIGSTRRNTMMAIAALNERMDNIEQAWDASILSEQRAVKDKLRRLLAECHREPGSVPRSPARSSDSSSSVASSCGGSEISTLKIAAESNNRITNLRQNMDELAKMEMSLLSQLDVMRRSERVKRGKMLDAEMTLAETYRQTIDHMVGAIRALNIVSKMPSCTRKPSTKAEVLSISQEMKRFLDKMQEQIDDELLSKFAAILN